MVQSVINIQNHLLQIAKHESINNTINNICIFKSLPKDNSALIELLINKYNTKYIDSNIFNIKLLYFDKIKDYLNRGYFIFENKDGQECYAINNLKLIKDLSLDEQDNILVYLIRKQDLVNIIERDFAEQNTYQAINHLSNILPNGSAKNVNYFQIFMGFAISFFSGLFLFLNLFAVVNHLVYFIQNFLKIILFKYSIINSKESPLVKIDDDLPIYSVLIPLYREELKAKSILQAMDRMNYPKHKLDVKIIIEVDDVLTMRALTVLELPSYVHIIKVPSSLPRTKPKALNYAMTYVKGEFVTIYDAEDEPDPDQILKALYAFNKLPENCACIQAKLNFYNAKENLLTRCFSIEYSLWFEFLLKGLSLLDLPVTLGGTSNHFKTHILKEIGYWDAYNVTEDADLGIRLYLNGYKVHLINSTTMEEAPTNIGTWIAQRARWIKGFIQTVFVFAKAKKDITKLNLISIYTVYIFVGLSTYSFLCMPWLLLILTLDIHYSINYISLLNSIFSFFYMYFIGFFALSRQNKGFKILSLIESITLVFWPFYFILHTIASYRAIWEALVSPFEWNKTPHGKNIDDIV